MRPRLKRSVESIETPEGDVLLMRSIGEDVRIAAPDEGERELLGALDGSHPMDVLEARFGERHVRGTIAQMQELGLVEDADDDRLLPAADLERFDRQLRYFSDVSGHDGPSPSECQRRLREARVVILGVGGLGGRVALELTCCGVGELVLIDGDEVEESNLNRQIQFAEADIGQPKAAATAERLRSFNSRIEVKVVGRRMESQAQIADQLSGASIVVDAADWPAFEIESWCNSACFEAGVPYIAMAQFPPKVRIGPLYVPGTTGCYECQRIAWRRDYPLFEIAVEQRTGQPSPAATLGPSSGLIGAQVAMDVVHFLTGIAEPASLGTACMYDLRTMEVAHERVDAEPGCPVCSDRMAAAR